MGASYSATAALGLAQAAERMVCSSETLPRDAESHRRDVPRHGGSTPRARVAEPPGDRSNSPAPVISARHEGFSFSKRDPGLMYWRACVCVPGQVSQRQISIRDVRPSGERRQASFLGQLRTPSGRPRKKPQTLWSGACSRANPQGCSAIQSPYE